MFENKIREVKLYQLNQGDAIKRLRKNKFILYVIRITLEKDFIINTNLQKLEIFLKEIRRYQ